ncbi:MAG: endopeptidase La [Sedimentisphaerales bacterium]|nr:endopeptidase La [Sedimentisphaerales bacterium]
MVSKKDKKARTAEPPAEPAAPPSGGEDRFGVSQVNTEDIDPDSIDVNSDLIDVPKLTSARLARPAERRGSGRRKQPPPPAAGASSDDAGPAIDAEADEPDRLTIPDELGLLALRNAVVFPGTVIPLAVGRPRSRRLLTQVLGPGRSDLPGDKVIGVITQKRSEVDTPQFGDLYSVGTVVTIVKLLKQPDGQNSLVVHGLVRFRVVEWLSDEPHLRARIEVLTPRIESGKNLDALVTSVRHAAQRMVELSPNIPDEVQVVLNNIDDAGALADFLAANINIPSSKKQELLETLDVTERLKKLSLSLAEQIELLEMSAKIQQQVSRSIDKSQREYFLQEQLKAIQTELGQTDQKSAEIEELRRKIAQAHMPESVQAEALRELDRLRQIPTMSPEFSVQRNYLEWLSELPWALDTRDKLELGRARRILNADHYDLEKVKKRILECLAVRKLNPHGRSPILCFAGPPGVGKTSLGRSIARSMGRKFVRISLGGIRDEADIRGHRRTYIGALPGRIIQELRKCASNNPVFMLDELDKIGQDFRGDPASALLEVLDPEQNNTFTDHYIDQPFDLSKVMFIGTANYMGPVPPALRDRMEVLELPGYTAEEKLAIARKYLVPRQLAENGLTDKLLLFRPEALESLIRDYTREAGVRELERKIAAVCRAVAADVAGGQRQKVTMTARGLVRLLGPARYESELALRTATPGVATGLAYTPVGGEILFVESTLTTGTGQLILTGQLGEVMKESAQTAVSVLKSLALDSQKGKKGILRGSACVRAKLTEVLADKEWLRQRDIHLHVPAGAVPKDGPSAGVAMFLSLASLFCDRPVRPDIAMTGEITLRGLVMPIGGVKEKLLAAKQAGIRTVILPERNRKDLHELPKKSLRGLRCVFVSRVEPVLRLALGKAPADGEKKTRAK